MKKLYQFYLDYGRQGDLEGLFLADEGDIKEILGKEVRFGEVLGKHSFVSEVMTEDMFTAIDVPEEALAKLESVLGTTWSGFNPIAINEENEEMDAL